MKIQFGVKQPSPEHNWEIYSPNQRIHIKTKYWKTYDIADSYAKILRKRHMGGAFSVRWCKPYPKRPIRIIKERLTLV